MTSEQRMRRFVLNISACAKEEALGSDLTVGETITGFLTLAAGAYLTVLQDADTEAFLETARSVFEHYKKEFGSTIH